MVAKSLIQTNLIAIFQAYSQNLQKKLLMKLIFEDSEFTFGQIRKVYSKSLNFWVNLFIFPKLRRLRKPNLVSTALLFIDLSRD